MSKTLILLKNGIETKVWTDFLRKLDNRNECLVLTEGDANASHIEQLDINVKVRSIGDYIPLSGTLDAKLYSDASKLADIWISRVPLSSYSRELEYDGIPLYQMLEPQDIGMVYGILRWVEALRIILSSAEWQFVYIFESQQLLANLFQVIAANVGFSGTVQRIFLRNPDRARWTPRQLRFLLPLLKPLYQSVAEGWGDQVVLDMVHVLKSRSFRELFRSPRRIGSNPYLFIASSYSTYLFTLLPVIRKMKDLGGVLVLPHGGMLDEAPAFRKHGIALSYWTRQVPISAWPRIVRGTGALRHAWDRFQADQQAHSHFWYKGVSLWPALFPRLRHMFLSEFPRMIVWAEGCKRIFESTRPRAIVAVPDRTPIARVALALAQHYGIPSLTVQTALISDHPQYGPMFADKIAVMNEYSRQIYLNRGRIPPERVVITGAPRWDTIAKVMLKVRGTEVSELRERLGLNKPEEKLVVYATEGASIARTHRMINAVMRVMSRYINMRLVIKVHPAESVEQYTKLRANPEGIGTSPTILNDIDLHLLLAASDLLVTGFSNVALEAALLDKPVLIINLTGDPDPLPFVQDGIALGAYSETEVQQQFDRIMNDPVTREQLQVTRRQYCQRNSQLLDGKATERVIDLLLQMAHGGKKV